MTRNRKGSDRVLLDLNRAYNLDCMDGLAQIPDKFFDLAIVDPPYGGAGQEFKRADKSRFGGRFDKYKPAAPSAKIAAGGVCCQ